MSSLGQMFRKEVEKPSQSTNGIFIYFILFLIFIFISSDLFIDNVIYKVHGTSQEGKVDNWGTVVQGFSLVGLFILAKTAISYGVL